MTEREILDLLHVRYGQTSQGKTVRYAVAEHVRSDAGFEARRTLDFVAMDLWPRGATGLNLIGHEIKCSRSDWLRELKDPSKALEFSRYMDQFWLVVADRDIVAQGELPTGWGLMAMAGTKLRAIVPATRQIPLQLPKGMLAALLRSVQCTQHRSLEVSA